MNWWWARLGQEVHDTVLFLDDLDALEDESWARKRDIFVEQLRWLDQQCQFLAAGMELDRSPLQQIRNAAISAYEVLVNSGGDVAVDESAIRESLKAASDACLATFVVTGLAIKEQAFIQPITSLCMGDALLDCAKFLESVSDFGDRELLQSGRRFVELLGDIHTYRIAQSDTDVLAAQAYELAVHVGKDLEHAGVLEHGGPDEVRDCFRTLASRYSRAYSKIGGAMKALALTSRLEKPTEADPPVPDGPGQVSGEFWWGGTLHKGLEPLPWRLLKHVWEAHGQVAQIDSLAEPVWQDREIYVERTTLKPAAHDIREFFRQCQIPLTFSQNFRAGIVQIQAVPKKEP